jgi:hypothetical protein
MNLPQPEFACDGLEVKGIPGAFPKGSLDVKGMRLPFVGQQEYMEVGASYSAHQLKSSSH